MSNSVTQSVPANMPTNSVRGAMLKYKNLVPAGPNADLNNTDAGTKTITQTFTAESGNRNRNNAVPPPLPAKKPSLPAKPPKKATPSAFVNPAVTSTPSPSQEQESTSSTDHSTRSSVLHVRPKSQRYSKVPDKRATTAAEEQINSVFQRASLSAAAVAEPTIALPVVDPEYSDLNTKENRQRILELHAGFNGVSFNYEPVEDTGRRRHPNVVDVCEPMTISVAHDSGPKELLHRILVREGPMEKLNRQHQFESYHFIMTHDALVYCEVTVKVASFLDSIRNMGSPEHTTSNPLAAMRIKDQKKKSGIAADEKLIYHRTFPFHSIMVA